MKVTLSTVNRLSLLGLIPEKGDLTTLKVIREMREELSFTQDEHALLNFQPTTKGKVVWQDVLPDKEFEYEGIKEIILNGVKAQLRTMEEKKELTLDHLPLYEILIEKKE